MAITIKNGKIVTPQKTFAADLSMENGHIAAIGENLPEEGGEAYDAAGCLLFAGFIDAHTHLDMSTGAATTADDFATGTRAAVCGGTTMLIDFATQDKGGTLCGALESWGRKADGKASCDYGFHMAITDWNPSVSLEIGEMARRGVTSFKVYMAYDNLRLRDSQIYEVLRRVGQVHGIVGSHCENGDLVNELIAGLCAEGCTQPSCHPRSRPDFVEAEAVARYCYIAQAAGVPVHVVHLSTGLGLREALHARARGVQVYIETCPQYLALDETKYALPGFEGAKYVCSPPLRPTADGQALWGALQRGEIQTVSTDHCSFNYAGQKELGRGDFSKIPNGLPGLEHRPAVLYTLGVASGRISENRMAALLSENAARLFGMYPCKGALAVGSDADIVVWDPSWSGVISARAQHQHCDYTPYEGMPIQGRAKAVFLRGTQVASDGEPILEGRGNYVHRGSSEYFAVGKDDLSF